MENREILDIIIPTKNDHLTIRQCLVSIKRQTVPCRVIIVDGYSTDKTVEICEEFGVEVYYEPKSSNINKCAEARNEGLKYSTSRLVGFIDSDSILPVIWAEDLMKYFNNSFNGVAAVTSGCKKKDKSNMLSYSIYSVLCLGSTHSKSFNEVTRIDSAPTYNVIYRRKVLNSIEKLFTQRPMIRESKNIRPCVFDETLGGCEDWELNYRIRKEGWSIIGVPKSPVDHKERTSLKSFAKQMFHYAWARARVTKLKKVGSLKYALPSITLLSLMFMNWIFPMWFIQSVLLMYLSTVILFSGLVCRSILAVPVMITHHLSWAFGYLWGLLS